MKTKIISLSLLALFTFVFLIGMVSALTLTASPTSVDLTSSDPSETLTVSSSNTFNIIDFNSTLTVSDGDGHSATITIANTSSLTGVTSATFDISVDDFSDFTLGNYDSTLVIDAENAADPLDNVTESIIITVQKGFCDKENPADLEVEIDSIDVIEGFGDDEDYWYPLDEVEIEIKVKDPDYDVENIEIEFCLYDVDEQECVLDEGDVDISEDDFDLDKNDDITTTLSFIVDPDYLTAGNTDYVIYVKATGSIDDSDAGADDGEDTCASDSQDIEIRTDEKFVIIDDIETLEETVECDGELKIVADVWNVGDKDIDDDEIFIRIFNSELGLDKTVEFDSGIDSMDMEKLDVVFQIPDDAKEGTYIFKMIAYDDEDMDDNDVYENEENDEAEYSIVVEVEGNCQAETPEATISASLESQAVAGGEMVIITTVENTGDEEKVYMLSVENYETWASSVEMSESTFSLEPGETKTISLTFEVDKDAAGKRTFNIKAVTNDGSELVQPVSVDIAEKSGFLTGFAVSGGNWYVWGLGILNVIFIVAIIIIATKFARK